MLQQVEEEMQRKRGRQTDTDTVLGDNNSRTFNIFSKPIPVMYYNEMLEYLMLLASYKNH